MSIRQPPESPLLTVHGRAMPWCRCSHQRHRQDERRLVVHPNCFWIDRRRGESGTSTTGPLLAQQRSPSARNVCRFLRRAVAWCLDPETTIRTAHMLRQPNRSDRLRQTPVSHHKHTRTSCRPHPGSIASPTTLSPLLSIDTICIDIERARLQQHTRVDRRVVADRRKFRAYRTLVFHNKN